MHLKFMILRYVNHTSTFVKTSTNIIHHINKTVVSCSSVPKNVRLFVTPWTAPCQPSLPSPSPGVFSTHVHRASDAIQPSHPVAQFFSCPQSFPAHRVFSNESTLHIRQPKNWSFSFSISPFNEYSGLTSFRIDGWISLKSKGIASLLQHHSSKASILQQSVFFMVHLSHPYMTTEKTITLTIQTFVGKVRPLLFNMLSRFVIAFLPRSQVSFKFVAAVTITVILEPRKIKSVLLLLLLHLFPMM